MFFLENNCILKRKNRNPNSLQKDDKDKDENLLSDMHGDGVHFDEDLKKEKRKKSVKKNSTNEKSDEA